MSSIGTRIAELRKKSSISQGQLAELLDVSRQAVSKWENDQTVPDTIKLIQLADVLNADLEYLAAGRIREPEIRIIEKPVEVVRYVQTERKVPVERIVEVEKTVEVEKIVEIEKPVFIEKTVETVVEKPVIRKVRRTRYVRNPLEFFLVGAAGLLCGLLIGLLL